jgi:hypothetical protein
VASRFSPRLQVLAGTSVLLAGCSFLVDFVERAAPDASEAGSPQDGSVTPMVDAVADRGDDSVPVSDAGIDRPITRDGTGVDEAQCANPCQKRDNGWYCGGDMLNCPAPSNDLYRCVADAVADVTHCVNGGGCLYLPNGHPDTCDPCFQKTNGTYCGHDFIGIVPQTSMDQNANFLFGCQGGRTQVGSKACPNNCSGTPGNAACN